MKLVLNLLILFCIGCMLGNLIYHIIYKDYQSMLYAIYFAILVIMNQQTLDRLESQD